MRQCIDGYGVDTTAAVAAYLAGTSSPVIRHLYLIGAPGDSSAYYLTDHEAPVVYSPWGTFQPAVITRGSVKTAVGLEIQQTTVTWTPGNLANGAGSFTQSMATASPLQMAQAHLFDNWEVRIWKIFMPSPGDAMTLGGCAWFGGRIGSIAISRSGLVFSVSSFLDVITQKVPANVIESTSTLASYT